MRALHSGPLNLKFRVKFNALFSPSMINLSTCILSVCPSLHFKNSLVKVIVYNKSSLLCFLTILFLQDVEAPVHHVEQDEGNREDHPEK